MKTHDWLSWKRELDDIHRNEDRIVAVNRSLWRVHNKLYDLSNLQHPGGQAFIDLTRNTDITELFETSHVNIAKARFLLNKFYVRDCKHPRFTAFFSFDKGGFYDTLRERAAAVLHDKPPLTYWRSSEIVHDILLLACCAFQMYFAMMDSWDNTVSASICLAGVLLGMLAVCAHNFFHKRDNWRMFSFDLALVSSSEWRVSHVYSHHNYANTFLDFEIQAFEPFVRFLPEKSKNSFACRLGTLMSLLIVPTLTSLISVRN